MATIKEQREKLQAKIANLQAQEKALASKEKEQERKARTKRLNELGEYVESKLNAEEIDYLKTLNENEIHDLHGYIAHMIKRRDRPEI